MAAFDREVWNLRERPWSTDNNAEASYSDLALREVIDRLTTPRASITDPTMQTTPPPTFVGDGLKVVAQSPAAMAVDVSAGVGFQGDAASVPVDIDGIGGVNDVSRLKPLILSALESFVVPANATGLTRIDIIEVRYRRELSDSTSRDIMPTTPPFTFAPTMVNKTLTWDAFGQTGQVTSPADSTAVLSYKVGVAGAGTPATTTGYVLLCAITVASGSVSIAQSVIDDKRALTAVHGLQRIAMTVTSQPSAGTHTISALTAPPGVEVTVANDTSTIDFNNFIVTVKPGAQATNVVPHPAMSNLGMAIFAYISQVTIAATNFSVSVRGRGFSPNPAVAGTLTFGTVDLDGAGPDVTTYLTIDYQQ